MYTLEAFQYGARLELWSFEAVAVYICHDAIF